MQVRDAYASIMRAVFVWSKDKGSETLVAEGINALENYNQAKRWVTFTPLNFASTTPDQFEQLREWGVIFQAEEKASQFYNYDGDQNDAMLIINFHSDLAELQELKQEREQAKTAPPLVSKPTAKAAPYVPYISPARVKGRLDRWEKYNEENPTIMSDPIQAMTGYWGDDAGYCIFLKKTRRGEA